jgi:hypothetical protein
MTRRILKRFLQVVKTELEWFQFRLWLKSRAVPSGFAQGMRRVR